jgi:Zn-dependent protease with chaperone function
VRLQPNRERALFHLVDRVATAIGAPVPHEIWVDTEANASARLSSGVFSRRVTLTIGLPLLYGLDVQIVAGILAHEFGHFAQRWGMRASYIVNSLNYWFHRRIYERDRWDDLVDYFARHEFLALKLAAWLAAFGSWFCRRLLLALASTARLLSLYLSRQMEFDADRYEIALIGSAQYRRTAEELRILSAGRYLAVQELAAAFDGGKLADNLPRLAMTKAASLTADDRKRILAGVARVNGTVFDSHPPDRARLERAVAANAAPQFVLEGPAARLLTEIERLSRLATLQWYRSYGIQVSPDALQPVAGVEAESNNFARVLQTRVEYFGALADLPQRPRLLPQTTLNDIKDDELSASLAARLAELRQREGEFVKALKDLSSQREYQYYYGQALSLRRAGINVSPAAFPVKLATTDPAAIERKLAAHRDSEAKLRALLVACTDLQGQRLSYALELAARRGAADRKTLDKLRRIYAAIGSTDKDAEALQASFVRLELLIRLASAFPDDEKRVVNALGEANTNEQLQVGLRSGLQNVPDPVAEHGTVADSLSRVATGGQPRTAVGILDDCTRMLRQLARVGAMVDGRLAEIALAAERTVPASGTQSSRTPKTAAR